MSVIAIVGAGMMGSALSAPFVANGHEVRLVGTPLDHDIIVALKASAPHPKLRAAVPGVTPYFVDELAAALHGVDAIALALVDFRMRNGLLVHHLVSLFGGHFPFEYMKTTMH